ncbi:MAG: ribosome small subunit-dependent GTPase A [Lentimicrobium sp.]|nr:ribosome small subunit-dependent GTPase A [Lentimicrobium sp.]
MTKISRGKHTKEIRSGTIVRSTGSWVTVMDQHGEMVECKLKGNFRIQGYRSTNPVAVGDKVQFITDGQSETGLVIHIEPRHNFIIRKATRLSRQSHIIAANIDQAVIMVTLAQPRTSTGFIDRFLTTSEAYHIPAAIIFNKCDLYDSDQMEQLGWMIDLYRNLGYTCIKTSAITGLGVEEARTLFREKVSLLSGHSGVGKSALINAIEPGLMRKTGDISTYHNKGKHTTTFAEMLPLQVGGFIIDTPGIKEFGLVHFDKQEIAERFPEMRNLMHDCQFNNCTHVHEPGCAVKMALEQGEIDPGRYKNYLGILNDDYFEETEWD